MGTLPSSQSDSLAVLRKSSLSCSFLVTLISKHPTLAGACSFSAVQQQRRPIGLHVCAASLRAPLSSQSCLCIIVCKSKGEEMALLILFLLYLEFSSFFYFKNPLRPKSKSLFHFSNCQVPAALGSTSLGLWALFFCQCLC